MSVDGLLRRPPFALLQAEREAVLLPELLALTRRHTDACPAYGRWVRAMFGDHWGGGGLEQLPWLPVGVFKTHDLVSVPEDSLVRTVTSSGTGGAVSRVRLDAVTADRQSRALAGIMQVLTGPQRLPMLVVDHEGVLRGGVDALSARAAGVVGMMRLGRDHVFALDADMGLRVAAVREFLARHAGRPLLVFGFTFMVWRHFLPAMAAEGLRCDGALLIHGGGWKALAAEAVDNETFKGELGRRLGIGRVHSFYGMAEQVGSVFLEGEDGLLHPPPFAEIIVRDPDSLQPLPPGETGVIQVLSLLPASYPGHSLLTEDMGAVHAVDAGPWGGKAFTVTGRVPRAQLRGCSDTHAVGLAP